MSDEENNSNQEEQAEETQETQETDERPSYDPEMIHENAQDLDIENTEENLDDYLEKSDKE